MKRMKVLPRYEALHFFDELCEGLAYAHQEGVIHRDLKAENLFVCESGGLKILDFGLATWREAELSERRRRVGTPSSMPPEQWLGQAQGASADVWAAAALLFEMITGQAALPSREQSLEGIPQARLQPLGDLAALVKRALALDPQARFADASQLRAAFRELRAEGQSEAFPYLYLEPFDETDAPKFFGREDETLRLRWTLDRHPRRHLDRRLGRRQELAGSSRALAQAAPRGL